MKQFYLVPSKEFLLARELFSLLMVFKYLKRQLRLATNALMLKKNFPRTLTEVGLENVRR